MWSEFQQAALWVSRTLSLAPDSGWERCSGSGILLWVHIGSGARIAPNPQGHQASFDPFLLDHV